MLKVRIYELARELNIDSKIIISKLKNFGVEVATHQSSISGEDAARVKASLSTPTGTKTKESISAAAPASESSSPKVVIRRRKATDAAPAAEAAPPEVVTSPVTPTPVVDVPRPAVAEPIVAAPPKAPPPVEPVVEVAAAAPAVTVSVEPPTIVTPAPSVAPQPTPPVQRPAASTRPAENKTGGTALGQEEIRRRIASSTGSGGATIVRKATPEEVEAQKQRLSQAQADKTGHRTNRKEDSRGMRVTGMGLLTRPRSAAADPNAATSLVPEEDQDQWSSRKERRGSQPIVEEEESPRAKQAKIKRAHATVSKRALLSQLDEDDSGSAEETPDVEVVTAPTEDFSAARTVFTPTTPHRKKDLKRRKDLKKTLVTTPRASYRVIKLTGSIQLNELAHQMSVKSAELIKKLMGQGVMATINQEIDLDTATLIATEYGFEVESRATTFEDIIGATETADSATPRPPIVTVMGHVDHGKTSVLDAIRQTDVAGGEAGGITQHIGAYTVNHNGQSVTFLDTPGHEAFSAMRARGASLTDIVVLVVAADDGVMPQTIEAIHHAKAANVPIIVAINKIDKPNTNFDRIYSQLSEHGIQSEDWGGENQFVKVSALQKKGLGELLDAILLQAEILELSAVESGPATGIVLEAHLDKGRGPVATIVVQSGTLQIGDYVVIGQDFGKVRAMCDYRNQKLNAAGPSTPVEIVGLSTVPSAGDTVNAVEDEKTAREAVEWRKEQQNKKVQKTAAAGLSDLLGRIQTADTLEVSLLVKADTQGSLEAVCDTVIKLSTPKITSRVVHRAVGGITESDISLAATAKAVMVGFNVRAPRAVEEYADRSGVPIKYFSIIYELVDAVKAIMAGKLPPILTEVVTGHAEVRQPFNVPKFGTIAGSAVTDGKIARNAHVRLIRDSVVIYTGKIGSLRRFKDDAKEVVSGYECGIGIEGYNDLREGDVIEAFQVQETAATL